jgi:hypothetical protein
VNFGLERPERFGKGGKIFNTLEVISKILLKEKCRPERLPD